MVNLPYGQSDFTVNPGPTENIEPSTYLIQTSARAPIKRLSNLQKTLNAQKWFLRRDTV